MKKKTCEHCQYFRPPNFMPLFPDGDWCSNNNSKFRHKYVVGFDTCDQFTKRGKKAPLWMRMLNKVVK